MARQRTDTRHFCEINGVIAAKQCFATVDRAILAGFLAGLIPQNGFPAPISPFRRDSQWDSRFVNEAIIAALLDTEWQARGRSSPKAQGR